jgi:hypothetical protein
MLLRKLIYSAISFLTAFASYGQVNLQTGSATFSLPMFNWQDDKSRMSSVVALSYNSGNGLKVNDVASNVGQGWNLVAGGVITRMQVGEPDDQKPFDGIQNHLNPNGTINQDYVDQDITKYPAGYLYATVSPTKGCPDALRKYPIYSSMNQLYTQHNVLAEDKQLDYFSFQFNGKAGMFVLDPANGSHGDIGMPLGDTKMKITFLRDESLISEGIRTTIKAFAIQDVDGIIYKFEKLALTKALQVGFCDDNHQQLQTQPTIETERVYQQSAFDNNALVHPWIVSSWYLTQIIDPLVSARAPIIFNYDPFPEYIDAQAGADMSYNNSLKKYIIITYKRSISKIPSLTSIVYPDGHSVSFNYSSDRVDLPGDKVLGSVDVSYQGRFLSKYLLGTTYVMKNRYGNPNSTYEKSIARLYLKSVKKIGVDLKEDSPPYLFDYFLGSSAPDDFVPPPFHYAKDIWGCYNGSNSVDYFGNAIPVNTPFSSLNFQQREGLCFLNNAVANLGLYLNPKAGYAKNGLLKQIVYPTGGSLRYSYSQNTGKLDGANTSMVGGVSVSQTSSSDNGYSNGCDNPVVTNYKYVLEDGTTSSLWGIEMPVNHSFQTNNHYEAEWKTWHYSLRNWSLFGECYYHYTYPGILSQQQAINLTAFQTFMNAAAPYLSILSIISTISDFATVIGGSTGVGAIVAVVVDIICGVVTVALTCLSDTRKDTPNTAYYNFDLNSVSPLPAQFKRVEVVEGSGTIGKTVQEFTSSDQYGLWYPTRDPDPNLDLVFPARQRFAPWAYGLPYKTTVFDVSGNKVKETENQYYFFSSQLECNPTKDNWACEYLISCKCAVVNMTSQRNTDWSKPENFNAPTSYKSNYVEYDANGNIINAPDANMKVVQYPMMSGRAELQNSYERTFKPGDPTQMVEVATSYLYNNTDNYEVSNVAVKQSNGDWNYKSIKYNSDFSGGIFDILKQNNITSMPVSTLTSVAKADGSGAFVLNEKVTEFVQLASGNIKPARLMEQRFAQPAPSLSVTSYKGPGINTNAYKINQIFNYDANDNLVGLKDEGGRSISNIYGYNDKYIVASVVNADPALDQVGYTSFEANSVGNWLISLNQQGGSLQFDNTKAITGTNSMQLSQGSFSHALNTLKPYLLSFWATSNNINISGAIASLAKAGPTLNGFTYYEYSIPAGNSAVTLSGNTNIDELRLFPINARMRTTTYDPLIGKTSECDENNRITYFEYDNLARLRFVRDESKNIVKMYEYNNVSAAKQTGCPASYGNNAITEFYTKSNCQSGYLGSDVPVTVPANMFTSVLSQEDADAQAEMYLLNNGPTLANSNGSCQIIYYNVAQSKTETTTNCAVGFYGGTVTYTVPAGTYSSLVSQADADDKAAKDILANSAAFANAPNHAVCTLTTDPDWKYLEGSPTSCQSVNCVPHLFVQETDLNPYSPTYNQIRMKDQGVNDACPVAQNCSFTAQPGFNVLTSAISKSGNTATFYIVFNTTSPGSTSWGLTNTIASIDCPCRPTNGATLFLSGGGGSWKMIIGSNGFVSVQLLSGTAPSGTSPINLNGSYSLN